MEETVCTVKDMIEFLSVFAPDTPVCHTGHFGETIDVKIQFSTLIDGQKVVEISVPYLGEDPD